MIHFTLAQCIFYRNIYEISIYIYIYILCTMFHAIKWFPITYSLGIVSRKSEIFKKWWSNSVE